MSKLNEGEKRTVEIHFNNMLNKCEREYKEALDSLLERVNGVDKEINIVKSEIGLLHKNMHAHREKLKAITQESRDANDVLCESILHYRQLIERSTVKTLQAIEKICKTLGQFGGDYGDDD